MLGQKKKSSLKIQVPCNSALPQKGHHLLVGTTAEYMSSFSRILDIILVNDSIIVEYDYLECESYNAH